MWTNPTLAGHGESGCNTADGGGIIPGGSWGFDQFHHEKWRDHWVRTTGEMGNWEEFFKMDKWEGFLKWTKEDFGGISWGSRGLEWEFKGM